MPTILFYLFAILMIAGGVCVVALKNPVSSAMGMIGSFIGLAALLIGLNAYFVGTLQVLVYAGAIMVLFIFIIMLLDLKKEEGKEFSNGSIAAGVIIPLLFVLVMLPILNSVDSDFTKLDGKALVASIENLDDNIASDSQIIKALRGEEDMKKIANPNKATLPDVNLIGQKLFTDYNFPLQVVGVLLLVATIGCVTLSKKLHGDEPDGEVDLRMAKTLAKSKDIPKVSLPALEAQPKAPEKIVEAKETEVAKVSEPAKQVELELESSPKNTSVDEKRGVIYGERPNDADDLIIIKGVGPVIEKKLNGFGIYTFKQISEWSLENVSEFDDLLSFKGRIGRDDWISQAAELAANKTI